MSHNSYYEIYLHLTWRTKGSACLLRGPIETRVHDFIRQRVIDSDDVFFDAVGGTDDHIHLAVHIAPTLHIAKWIGQIKGATAHHINHGGSVNARLEWQTGYGVLSFGKKNLPFVVDYIRNQRQKHGRNHIVDRLERSLAR